jgi:hypothetical protein
MPCSLSSTTISSSDKGLPFTTFRYLSPPSPR